MSQVHNNHKDCIHGWPYDGDAPTDKQWQKDMSKGYVKNLCYEWEWMVVGMDSPKLSHQRDETIPKVIIYPKK